MKLNLGIEEFEKYCDSSKNKSKPSIRKYIVDEVHKAALEWMEYCKTKQKK